MAVQFEAANYNMQASGATNTTTLTVGAYSQRILWIQSIADGSASVTFTVNGSSTGIVNLSPLTDGTQVLQVSYLLAPSPGMNTIQASYSGTVNSTLGVRAYHYVNQTAPIGAVYTGTSVTTSITLSTPLVASEGDLAIDCVGWDDTSGFILATAAESQTVEFNNSGFAGLGLAGGDLSQPPTPPTMGWTFSFAGHALLLATSLRPEQTITPDRTMPMTYFQSWS